MPVLIGLGVVLFQRYGPPTAPPPTLVANRAFLSTPSPRRPAVVWAVGDGAEDGSGAARAVARRIAVDHPARLLYLGDVYERGSPKDFRDGFSGIYGSLARRTAPTPATTSGRPTGRGMTPSGSG